jgi:hypothetical protein
MGIQVSDAKRIPATIRYNNPGGQWPGPSSERFGELDSVDLNDGLNQGNKAAVFPSAVHGGAALFDLYNRQYAGQTLRQALNRWAGGNNIDSYLSMFSQHMGLGPNDVINSKDIKNRTWAIRFAKTMARHEAGVPYPMDDRAWQQAHAMAFPKVEVPKPLDALRKAPVSIFGTIMLFITWLGNLGDTVFGVAMTTATKVAELTPVKTLLISAGANKENILLAMIAVGGAIGLKVVLTPK